MATVLFRIGSYAMYRTGDDLRALGIHHNVALMVHQTELKPSRGIGELR